MVKNVIDKIMKNMIKLKKKKKNSSTFYLMHMLFKSLTKKYMIMVKNVIDKIMKNMIKLFF